MFRKARQERNDGQTWLRGCATSLLKHESVIRPSCPGSFDGVMIVCRAGLGFHVVVGVGLQASYVAIIDRACATLFHPIC